MEKIRSCPACGALKQTVLHKHKFADLIRINPVSGYDVVQCLLCGCVFAGNIPEQKYFDEYYKTYSKYGNAAISERTRNSNLLNANFISGVLSDKNAGLLDIGCGKGLLLGNLKELGHRNLRGIELSAECVEDGKKRGLDIRNVSLERAADAGETYQAVSLSAILEHIRDVQEFLALIKKIMTPGGYLFIAVPDAAGFTPEHGGPFQDFSIEHINYFCLHSLVNLLGCNGFGLKDHISAPGALYAAFQYNGRIRPVAFEGESRFFIERYVQRSQKLLAEIEIKIKRACGERFIVYCTGTHTLTLLAHGTLNIDNIVCFSDINPHYIGSGYHGKLVVPPTELVRYSEPILISSCLSQSEIVNYLRNDLGCGNIIVTLY